MRTFVYIDGFNLYYRLRNNPHYKWLNLHKLISLILNQDKYNVLQIKYFTALITKSNSSITRQNIYLRALQTIHNLEIIYGKFKKRQVRGSLCKFENGKYREKEPKEIVTINKWEEKESDVNIATHIVMDAYGNRYDCAILLSNDSDLKEPLRCIKKHGKVIGIVCPKRMVQTDLKKNSHFQKRITNRILSQCQFSKKLEDEKGEFYCPKKWHE